MRPQPRPSMPGSAAWTTFHVPVRLTSMTRRQSSSATASLAPVALDASRRDDDVRRPELGLDARNEGANRIAIDDVDLARAARSPPRAADRRWRPRWPSAASRRTMAAPSPPPAPETIATRSCVDRRVVWCMARRRPYRRSAARSGGLARACSSAHARATAPRRQRRFSSHRSMRPSIAATPTGSIAACAVKGARLAQDLGRVEAHALGARRRPPAARVRPAACERGRGRAPAR